MELTLPRFRETVFGTSLSMFAGAEDCSCYTSFAEHFVLLDDYD